MPGLQLDLPLALTIHSKVAVTVGKDPAGPFKRLRRCWEGFPFPDFGTRVFSELCLGLFCCWAEAGWGRYWVIYPELTWDVYKLGLAFHLWPLSKLD